MILLNLIFENNLSFILCFHFKMNSIRCYFYFLRYYLRHYHITVLSSLSLKSLGVFYHLSYCFLSSRTLSELLLYLHNISISKNFSFHFNLNHYFCKINPNQSLDSNPNWIFIEEIHSFHPMTFQPSILILPFTLFDLSPIA
jgi:hypothetical protein